MNLEPGGLLAWLVVGAIAGFLAGQGSSLQQAGLTAIDRTGVSYNPLADSWRLSAD